MSTLAKSEGLLADAAGGAFLIWMSVVIFIFQQGGAVSAFLFMAPQVVLWAVLADEYAHSGVAWETARALPALPTMLVASLGYFMAFHVAPAAQVAR